MGTISHIEHEVNQIRLKIHEETKDLTKEQYRAQLDRITESTAKRYGLKVITSEQEERP
ncbi:MAG: hypothetical protein FWE94_00820 [Coriobacteriia bacterium]|nr:hypothetical protein [Coriobacteriia bacterium]